VPGTKKIEGKRKKDSKKVIWQVYLGGTEREQVRTTDRIWKMDAGKAPS